MQFKNVLPAHKAVAVFFVVGFEVSGGCPPFDETYLCSDIPDGVVFWSSS